MFEKKIQVFSFFCFFTVIFIFCCSFFKDFIAEKIYQNDKIESVSVKEKTNHLIIYSTIYYNFSKLYAPNSMILLINAHKNTKINETNLQCFSKNSTANLTTFSLLRMANFASADCSWEFFIANCSTVRNPDYFGLKLKNTKKVVKIKFEYPEQSNQYPVTMCYPPMVYESRWQQIIFATEIYRYFGADLQVQYINSAMEEIVDILQIYEAKKWIKIEKFAFFDFNTKIISSIGEHPMLELKSRNQPLAYTNCLMKYREASEFIIVADVDDVLFPKKNTFLEEFSYWKTLYPNAAAFMYHRSFAKIDVAKQFKHFSISKTIQSIKNSDKIFAGKSVYQTKKAETAWIHWPGLDNSSTISIPPGQGRMFHIQMNDFRIRKVKNIYEFGESENLNELKSFISNIPERVAKEMETNFTLTFKKEIKNFEANPIYSDFIFHCYKKHENWFIKLPCKTLLQCKKPKSVENFNCKIAQRNFTIDSLSKNIVLYIPVQKYFWTLNKNGCKILST